MFFKTNIYITILTIGMAFFSTAYTDAAKLEFATQEFAPFSYTVDKEIKGPGPEIVRLVCSEMNIDCSIRVFPWRRALIMAQDGNIQGLFLIGKNKEREKWLVFSPPLLTTEYGIFVKDSNPLEVSNIQDIEGYDVGVYGPSNTSHSLEKIKAQIKDLKIKMDPNDEPCFNKLSLGRVDAVYSNKDVGFALIRKLELKNIRYAGTHKKLQYHIGIVKRNTDKKLSDRFNQTLRKLCKQGAIQKILAAYHMIPAQGE